MSSSAIDRRAFIAAGVSAAGATMLGVSAAACSPDRALGPNVARVRPNSAVKTNGDLPEPRVISSVGGLLQTSIACTTTPVIVGGRHAREAVTYDGTFPGPTLWVRPGDTIDLTLTNKIVFDQDDTIRGRGRPARPASVSNLHYHGMHVSPVGSADNMLVMVPRNGSYRYLFQVPADHPAGLYWYHAHVHPFVTSQVGRGAAGMLYVANAHTDQVAGLGIRRRLMMLQQAYFESDLSTEVSDDGERDNPDLALSLINGSVMPDLVMRPGEPQVWCLANGSTSAFYVLRLEGHTFDVIAEDGIPLRAPRLGQETLMLASANRLEVIVRATGTTGRYALSYDQYDQGVDIWPQKQVGTVVVNGSPWTGPDHPGVDASTPIDDLSGVSVPNGRKRELVLAVDDSVPEGEFGRFTINGRAYAPDYREWTSTLDTVEEWHFVNTTEQEHPMHVHVNPFQIIKINGAAVPFDGYRDTATVPRFGSLTVRTRLADFEGFPVLIHCHILDHEDMGMMTSFEIAPALL